MWTCSTKLPARSGTVVATYSLDWAPRHTFEAGLSATARWYFENRAWSEGVQQGRYDRGRLGVLNP